MTFWGRGLGRAEDLSLTLAGDSSSLHPGGRRERRAAGSVAHATQEVTREWALSCLFFL